MSARRFRVPAWTARLTWKAAAFIAVMCCALAALLGALVHVSVTHQTVGQAREKALTKLEDATRAYEAGDPLPPGSGIDPAALPASLRALALTGRHGTVVTDHYGRPTMWAAGPADDRAIAATIDYSQSVRTITGLDRAIVGSSVLAIAVTLLIGVFGVTRVTRRLHQTATVARRISAGDLDARVNDPRTKGSSRPQDEVATVSGALDTMASTLQGKLLSEQRFTADVAHELRTPLTGLHAAAELLPPGRPTHLVQDRVRAMRLLTEDLLEISRLDAGSEKIQPDLHRLGPLAERVVRMVRGSGAAAEASASGAGEPQHAEPRTELAIMRDAYVETDRRRLERVLGNLLVNAHKHGRAPVVVTVDGPVVTVRDHGAGYPEYLLAHGPQRFRTEPRAGAKGHGLGLTIAVGQAGAIHARLTFSNAPDGGAVATLTLPEAPESDAPVNIYAE
ncbi:HAMP domain-containing sensor histidine kinase [Streptomyces sp. H27-C3]|uniref:HAMP domain-containing sensor histidine kinase n=1 Tax=Streptomyces sp. H27-C3 TaxID=3046305 RepID=UPI0024B9C89D|nr:HAMP domain-containing sensor histidine kinase [Streptomyces sp. H27-C3]MDJ0462240.1 HAMP domain-containing sensor histidine kinase [Streptomyces sp. H27-C3]